MYDILLKSFLDPKGPYKQYKSASWQHKSTGPISIVVYEDPEDKIPKIHVRCDKYMIWIQEQKMPLHLHVGKDRNIGFDQVNPLISDI